jgi:hypothetical protein
MGWLPMTAGMDDDVEMQRPHEDRETPPHEDRETQHNATDKVKRRKAHCTCIVFLIAAVITGCVVFFVEYYGYADPAYSVRVDSASVVPDLTTAPSFNLTLRIASRSHGTKACTVPDTYVEVLYGGVQVAATNAAEMRRTCARPRRTAELPMVATATGTAPNALDKLAAETAVFDLRLHMTVPSRSYGSESCTTSSVSDCRGSRVGDAAVRCGSPKFTTQQGRS